MVVGVKVRIVVRNVHKSTKHIWAGATFYHRFNTVRANYPLNFASNSFSDMPITLYIVRHAKAEDRATFMADHDRQLTADGTIAAARMGRYLKGKAIRPDVVISSTAPRAKDTAMVMAEQIGYDPAQIQLDNALFDGGPKAYLAALNALPASVQSAMIVGHNPDVSYLAEYLTHQSIGSMSKGAVVAIVFDDVNWAELSGRTGHVTFEVGPKQLPAE